jgi:DNA-binding transcriptional ArsR family regulator
MADELVEMRAAALKALGQPTRLRILELLRNGERCVCEIFPAIQEEQSNVSRHLAVLRSAGLVAARKEGLNVHYRVKDRRLFDLLDGVDAVLHAHLAERRHVTRRLAARYGRSIARR